MGAGAEGGEEFGEGVFEGGRGFVVLKFGGGVVFADFARGPNTKG